MKNIIYTACLFLVLFTGTSCNKWLDLQPRDGITRNEFWRTKEDIAAAVSGAYASILAAPTGVNERSVLETMFIFGELRADMISPGTRMTTEELEIMNVNTLQDNSFTKWGPIYRTINLCNTILDYAPSVKATDPTLTDADLNAFVSEALTLRSLMYFYLVRTFGDVPLKLVSTSKDTDIQQIGKTPRAKILEQIVADLKKAEQGAKATYGNSKVDKERVVKYTVNALLADVYLWLEMYPECITECNKIIDSQRFALVSANSSWFTNVFYNGSSIETVFEFDQPIENPFYNLFVNSNKRYTVNQYVSTDIFIPDDLDPDNVYDIRASSYYSPGLSIEKYGTENPSYVKWQVYRISDIMMMKAEALALTQNGLEALALVDDLRTKRRAVAQTALVVDPSDTEALCDYILAERSREFAFEGKRWFDLLRHAKRNNYSRLDILLSMVARTVAPTMQQSAITKFKDPNSHYLPIFQDELFADPTLVQNPFYAK